MNLIVIDRDDLQEILDDNSHYMGDAIFKIVHETKSIKELYKEDKVGLRNVIDVHSIYALRRDRGD